LVEAAVAGDGGSIASKAITMRIFKTYLNLI